MKSISRRIICKIGQFQNSDLCSKAAAFREAIDTKLTNKWNQILSTISSLTEEERQTLRTKTQKHGIHEIYKQTLLFQQDHIQVRDFQKELENKYGRDTRSRKGNEIIFTTEQLLESHISCEPLMLTNNRTHLVQCSKSNQSTINSVFN